MIAAGSAEQTKNKRTANDRDIRTVDNTVHHEYTCPPRLGGRFAVGSKRLPNRDRRSPPLLAVVIPVFNEQDSIVALLAEVERTLAGRINYELIAVDDGSIDDTATVLSLAARRISELRIVRMPHNRGQSAALANGIHAARAPLIATLDGDGQNPPADIFSLVDVYRERAHKGACLVVGWRRARNDSLPRRLSSRLANGLRGRLLRDGCPDTGCGLKVFAREDFLALPRFRHMHRFLPALFARAGAQVISVPVAHRPRRAGRSKYGVGNRLWTGLLDMVGVYWLQRRACRIEYEVDDA